MRLARLLSENLITRYAYIVDNETQCKRKLRVISGQTLSKTLSETLSNSQLVQQASDKVFDKGLAKETFATGFN